MLTQMLQKSILRSDLTEDFVMFINLNIIKQASNYYLNSWTYNPFSHKLQTGVLIIIYCTKLVGTLKSHTHKRHIFVYFLL